MAELSARGKFINVLLLSFSFMLVFTGFQTSGMVAQTVLNSYINDTTRPDGTSSFHGDGYTSLAIIYIVFAFANWFAPSVVSVIGPKLSMVVGAVSYVLYLASYIKPLTWTLYATSVLIGLGGGVLWTAQGNFLTINSSKETMGRNSGLFWAVLQSSFLIGNLYVFFAWKGIDEIHDAQRVPLYIGLTAISTVGVLCFFLLRNPPATDSSAEVESEVEREEETTDDDAPLVEGQQTSKMKEAYAAFLESVELFKTKEMALLSITFFYTGLELTFFSGVYSTSVGATKQFGADADKLVGLVGIVIGIGEIAGGLLFGIFGKKTIKYGRDPIILLGGSAHIVAFFLVFINLPAAAPIATDGTMDRSYMEPSSAVAILCAFLLGFCDACFNTQCYSILGATYPSKSAPAFALFKFVQCLAAAIGFFYSSHLALPYQLLLLAVFDIAGMLAFIRVEQAQQMKHKIEANYSDIPS